MPVPIPRASCGPPVTVTGIWKTIRTAIPSPAPYVLSLPASLKIAAEATAGTVAVAPFTFPAATPARAWLPRLSDAAAPKELCNVPPASDRALSATANPSASTSVD